MKKENYVLCYWHPLWPASALCRLQQELPPEAGTEFGRQADPEDVSGKIIRRKAQSFSYGRTNRLYGEAIAKALWRRTPV